MDLDLRQVRYVVAVADELHFGRAAARLHVSQPALSKQVRLLEAELGFRLFARDSRHVALTPAGTRFVRDARTLLAQAGRMVRPESSELRVAHIFDLDTSRVVVDEFTAQFPEVSVLASSMDGQRQLDALMNGQLDVAILRVTSSMTRQHPSGWHHRLLRLEPFWLVGEEGGPHASTASLFDRPVKVFADPSGSATFNAHGEYLAALEHRLDVEFEWLGNPGTFDHCLARMRRSRDPGRLLEFESYAFRYREIGLPIHLPRELQPVYPWSIAWRDDPVGPGLAALLDVSAQQAAQRGWLTPGAQAPVWPVETPEHVSQPGAGIG